MKRSANQEPLRFGWDGSASFEESRQYLSKIKWSYSRRSVMEQCPRRYFLEYYGSAAAGSFTATDLHKLRLLKSLQSRYERTGAIAHLVISVFFKKAQAGDVWDGDRLWKWAREILQGDIEYSKGHRDNPSQKGQGNFPPALLHEFYYQDPDASRLCAEAEVRLLDGLRNFASSTRLVNFRTAGMRAGTLVESVMSIPELPCNVSGKLDLGFTDQGRVHVVDWKLGESQGGGEDSLQLAAYALGAAHRFQVEADSVGVYKAYLNGDTVVEFPINLSVLRKTRVRIVQDAERMAAMHEYGLRGVREAFTPCIQPAVCRTCPFQEICPEGRATINA